MGEFSINENINLPDSCAASLAKAVAELEKGLQVTFAKSNGAVSMQASNLDPDDVRDLCRILSEEMERSGIEGYIHFITESEDMRWALICTARDYYDLNLEEMTELAAETIVRNEEEQCLSPSP